MRSGMLARSASCRRFAWLVLVQILIATIAFVRTARASASAYSQYDGAYHVARSQRAGAATYDLLCPASTKRAHLVVVVPERGTEPATTEGEAAAYARRGFAAAVPRDLPSDAAAAAAVVSDLARAIPKTSPCVLDDGRVGLVGAMDASDVVLRALPDRAGFSRVARVVVLPRARVETADEHTLVLDTSARALEAMAATAAPTIAGVDDLVPCDYHATCGTPRDGPDLANARRTASIRRTLTVESRAVAWLAFELETNQPSPFASSVADVATRPLDDFLPKTIVAPVFTVDALFGYTWRSRDVGAAGGGTAILRVELAASLRRKLDRDDEPERSGTSYGGYVELGTTGDQDFVYGGGATVTAFNAYFMMSASAGGYGRVAQTNAGGVALGGFVGLRRINGENDPVTPVGVRVEGRFGVDAHPEESVAVLFEIAPFALLELGGGLAGLAALH